MARNNLIADYIKSNYNYENSILTSFDSVREYLNFYLIEEYMNQSHLIVINKLKNEEMKKIKNIL